MVTKCLHGEHVLVTVGLSKARPMKIAVRSSSTLDSRNSSLSAAKRMLHATTVSDKVPLSAEPAKLSQCAYIWRKNESNRSACLPL